MKKIIIAIDGHSSSGKSTMAKELAKTIGYIYIDTGAMYRAVALYCLRNALFKGDVLDTERLQREIDGIRITFKFNRQTGRPETCLNGEVVEKEIRSMEVSAKVSPVSALGFVRKVMVARQQAMGREKGVVMDGRDIGTVVFPHAELKIFVTASPEIRARRRLDELLGKGESATYEDVYRNVITRDRIDSTREESPLKQAPDAIVLDNSTMTVDEQRQWLFEHYQNALNA
jgi:cytidylate kinase